MKVILYNDVPNLGEEGDIKIVADGYARNYLIPRKFAVRYTKATEVELAQKQQAITRRKTEKLQAVAGDKERIESLEMNLAVAAGEKGKLFGSVTAATIMDYFHSQGIVVERKRIELPENGIKIVGSHTVTVKLYGGEKAILNVNVSALGDTSKKVEASGEDKADDSSADPEVEDSAVAVSGEG